jgi:hypothetical protein
MRMSFPPSEPRKLAFGFSYQPKDQLLQVSTALPPRSSSAASKFTAMHPQLAHTLAHTAAGGSAQKLSEPE